MLSFGALLLWQVLVVSSTEYKFTEWIDHVHAKELRTAYYRLLDHNNDDVVTLNEIAIGILSQLQSKQTDATLNAAFIPESYTCNPSLDFVDFADCVSIAARYAVQNDATSNALDMTEPFGFEQLFSEYLGECTDVSPTAGTYCHDLVELSPESCMIWSRTNQPFCQLSCYACNTEPTLFDVHPIHGTNGKYMPRPERLTTYYHDFSLNAVKNCSAVKTDNHTGQILFISDIHVEPWYNVDGSGEVSRFSGADINNMFECRNNDNNQVPCGLNMQSDPPYPLWYTGMQFLKDHAMPRDLSKTVLIMGGDTQAHDYTSGISAPLTETVAKLLSKIEDEILALFPADNVFYAAGNNDGQHDSIFCSGSDPAVNAAWAGVHIGNNVVNNALNRVYSYNNQQYTQVTLFNQTGYYVKKLPEVFSKSEDNEAFYVIILNTNLGLNNDLQNDVFNQDLEWIQKQTNGRVVVVGHHPNIVSAIVPSKYESMVKGKFSGHVHYFQPSDSNLFAILPATTQYAEYSAVMTADLDSNSDIVLTWNNFNQYFGSKGELPQENCWGYNGPHSFS